LRRSSNEFNARFNAGKFEKKYEGKRGASFGGEVFPGWKFAMRGIRAVVWAAVFFAVCAVAEGAEPFRIVRQGEAYIGCEVLLSLDGKEASEPGVAYEWSFRGDAQSILLRRGGLECRFIPFDTKPITATAKAVDAGGAMLASTEMTLSAREFTVDIVQVQEAPFMLWDSTAKEDVAAEGFVAGEPVRFELKLTPEYKGKIQAWWSTDASMGIVGDADEPQITVVRNEIGDSELSVAVVDVNGLVLGRGTADVSVSVSRSKVSESNRRRKAWTQWTEALGQWEAKKFDEAVERAQEAMTTDPENLELADGVKTMLANHARVERSRKLAEEAASLRNERKFVEALKLYRRSNAAWAAEETRKAIGTLEAEIDAIRVGEQEIEWLKDVAASYDQENRFADALGFYKELLTLISDDAVAQRVDRIEKRLVSIENAGIFVKEGRELEAGGRLQEALDKYKESLKLEANAEVEGHARELEEAIKERKARAVSLRREASDLQRKRDNAQALLRYMESQVLWPDNETERRIAALKKIVGELSSQDIRSSEDFGIGTRADAARLLRTGHDLYGEGRYREALNFYRRSYAVAEDLQLKNWIERVESSLKEYEAVQKANALIKEGNSLYNGRRYSEALEKYKASLLVHPNAEVESFLKKLENTEEDPGALAAE
jgi:tetratricopeptide (TPR) repeat protein